MERNCPTLPTFWLPHQLICQDSDSNYNVQGRFWVWEPLFMWLMWQICSRTLDGRQFIKSTLFWLLQNNVLHTIVFFFMSASKIFVFFFQWNLLNTLLFHPIGSMSFEAGAMKNCIPIRVTLQTWKWLWCSFSTSPSPSFLLFSSKGSWEKADENNLHVRDRMRRKRRRGKKLWDGGWWCKSEARRLIPQANDPATGMQTLCKFR